MRIRSSLAMIPACCAPSAAQTIFTWCGGVPDGQWLGVKGVAAAGAAIVGTGNFPFGAGGTIGRAFRWTAATGIVDLGALPTTQTIPYSDAYAVSTDGAVLTGRSYMSGDRAIRWTPATGMVELGTLPGATAAGGTCIAAEGQSIVGWCTLPGGTRVARWTGASVQDLGVPPWATSAIPWGATPDLSVITGYAFTTFAVDRAFVRDASGWTDLGFLPGDTIARAYSISADGLVVAGYSRGQAPQPTHAFRWTRAGGLEPLPTPPGATGLLPLGVSGDGSVIVGAVGSGLADGFIWTRAGGVQNARTVLTSLGVDLTGWSTVKPTAITPDGRTLAGTAIGTSGHSAWVATLPPGFGCYANCDASTTPPILSLADFTCFINSFHAGQSSANCDGSIAPPTLNVGDFVCFLNKFAAGCP